VLSHRVLTVSIILPVFLAALFWLPQRAWGALLLVVVLLAAFEWAKLANLVTRARAAFIVLVAFGCLVMGAVDPQKAGTALLVVGVAFWLGAVPLWLSGKLVATPARIAAAGFIVLVCAWYALYLLQANPGRLLALLAIVWVADTAAYFVGRRFGRRKLAPRISPGKTWEGVMGAAAAVGVYYALLWLIIAPGFLGENRSTDLVLVAAVAALSIEGDLFESWMKRRAGVKDSGALLPGHGGILDRIDGVVAVLPLAALVTIASNA
jgi:phosphatidate cytidylyltransferase